MKKIDSKYLESMGKDYCYYYIPKSEIATGDLLGLVKSGEIESVRTYGEDKWQVQVKTENVALSE